LIGSLTPEVMGPDICCSNLQDSTLLSYDGIIKETSELL